MRGKNVNKNSFSLNFPEISKNSKSKYFEIDQEYDQLYEIWHNRWETKPYTWQIIFLLCICAIVSVSWLALTFYTKSGSNYIVQFYFGFTFGLILLLPFLMVVYFGIRLNNTFDLFKDLICQNVINITVNGNEWSDNVRLKAKIEKYPIQCNLFGYPVTLTAVVNALLVFVVSKIISVLIEYQYGY